MGDTDPVAVLRTLAALAPAGGPRSQPDVFAGAAPPWWLGARPGSLGRTYHIEPPIGTPPGLADNAAARRLAALDRLRREERLLREGWVVLCGPAGNGRRLCTPLLSRPIRLKRSIEGFLLVPAGDPELTPLVKDPDRAEELEQQAQFGGGADLDEILLHRLTALRTWIDDVAGAAGLRIDAVLGGQHDLRALRDGHRLVAVVGTVVYVAADRPPSSAASRLSSWTTGPRIAGTAFASLYGSGEADALADPVADVAVVSPLPLTDHQRAAVRSARTQPITTITGAPGCGKSHTLVAIALDAVLSGRTVLVATRSPDAADVLADLFARQPGPDPVLFGDAEGRDALVRQLQGELTQDGAAAPDRSAALDAATARVHHLECSALASLTREADAAALPHHEPLLPSLVATVPQLFDGDGDLDEVSRLVATAHGSPVDGFWAGRRRRRAGRRLTRLVGAQVDVGTIVTAVAAARSVRAAAELDTTGGTRLAATWSELAVSDAAQRAEAGHVADQRARVRRGSRSSRTAVTTLIGALRTGRARRRALLARIDSGALLAALPLWVGTLADIDDLLPAVPRLFDLALLDEASQIDQRDAPAALLRATRAVVAGDPQQLRHVSFVADAAVEDAVAKSAAGGSAGLLDVRRLSIYDLAAAAAAPIVLGEHLRSGPHLIGFSARRFYDGKLVLLTRRPSDEARSAIDVVHVAGHRAPGGANAVEVAAVLDVVRQLRRDGARSVGVVTPYRAQADALQAALLEQLQLEDIDALDLRVGTVHAFQGSERDVVIASLAITAEDPPSARAFAADRHLLNVLVTRARHRMIVVTSLAEGAGGLIGEYLRYAARPPAAEPDSPARTAWVRDLAAELRRTGRPVAVGYHVGRWTLDIAVDAGDHPPYALDCAVDPGGPSQHLERTRQLSSAGWRLLDAWPSRFGGNPALGAVQLGRELDEPPAG